MCCCCALKLRMYFCVLERPTSPITLKYIDRTHGSRKPLITSMGSIAVIRKTTDSQLWSRDVQPHGLSTYSILITFFITQRVSSVKKCTGGNTDPKCNLRHASVACFT